MSDRIAISNVIVQSTPRIGTLFFIYAIFSVCGLGAWASIMYLGTGLRYEIDDEGTVTLSESEDESDESRTWESDESECREFHVANGRNSGRRFYCSARFVFFFPSSELVM